MMQVVANFPRKLLMFAVFCLNTVTMVFGQISAPKYANEFLTIGAGARALGMGGAFVAVDNDASAGYWNPAGLNYLPNLYQASLMHAEYFSGIASFDHLALAAKADTQSVIALNIVRFAVDDIPNTLYLFENGVPNYDRITSFSIADYAGIISYARRNLGIKNLDLGVSFKIVHRSIGQFGSGWGAGLDAGALYTLPTKTKIGLAWRDALGTFTAYSYNTSQFAEIFQLTGNRIPENSVEAALPRLIFGFAQPLTFSKFGIMPSLDIETTFDGKRNVFLRSDRISADPRIGLETHYNQLVFIRLGASGLQQSKQFDGSKVWMWQPAFGIGLKFKNLKIDYALTNAGNQSDVLYSHVFSLQYGFDK